MITGRELDQLSMEEFEERVEHITRICEGRA